MLIIKYNSLLTPEIMEDMRNTLNLQNTVLSLNIFVSWQSKVDFWVSCYNFSSLNFRRQQKMTPLNCILSVN